MYDIIQLTLCVLKTNTIYLNIKIEIMTTYMLKIYQSILCKWRLNPYMYAVNSYR